MRFVLLLAICTVAVSACSGSDDPTPTPVPTLDRDLRPTSLPQSVPTETSTSGLSPTATVTSAPTLTPTPSATPSPAPTTTPTPGVRLGENLLANGDFELGSPGADGWELIVELLPGQSVEWTSEESYSGSRALKLSSPATAEQWIVVKFLDRIAVDPDSRYWVTARVKTEAGAVFWAGWKFFESDEDETFRRGGSSGQIPVTEEEWTELRSLFSPRLGLPSAEFDLQLAMLPEIVGLDPDEQMVLFIDDIALREELD